MTNILPPVAELDATHMRRLAGCFQGGLGSLPPTIRLHEERGRHPSTANPSRKSFQINTTDEEFRLDRKIMSPFSENVQLTTRPSPRFHDPPASPSALPQAPCAARGRVLDEAGGVALEDAAGTLLNGVELHDPLAAHPGNSQEN